MCLMCLQDVTMVCKEGAHLKLLSALGIPGLLIFALGVPFASATFLTYFKFRPGKKDSNSHNGDAQSAAGVPSGSGPGGRSAGPARQSMLEDVKFVRKFGFMYQDYKTK